MFDEYKGLGTLDYSPSSQNSHGVLANAVTVNALVGRRTSTHGYRFLEWTWGAV